MQVTVKIDHSNEVIIGSVEIPETGDTIQVVKIQKKDGQWTVCARPLSTSLPIAKVELAALSIAFATYEGVQS